MYKTLSIVLVVMEGVFLFLTLTDTEVFIMGKSINFGFVPKNVRGCMTDEELDEVLSGMGLAPDVEKAVRKVCKHGFVDQSILEDSDDEDGEDYPSTSQEKLDYAKYVTMKSLEGISKALIRFDRLCGLSKLNAPDIIINNECRMTLQSLCPVWADIDEACGYVKEIFDATAEKKGGSVG